MILGVSKTDITPSLPVRLGGFAFRHQPCTQIGMPLYARCFIWDRQYAVVSLELLFAGDNLDRQIRTALADIPKLAGLDLILTATHSHCAPQTADNHSPQLGECDPHYTAFITQQVITGLQTALAAGKPVTAQVAVSDCPLAVHRRLMVNGEIIMAPNPDEPADTTATLVRFTDADQNVCAVLVHNQCHPTITGDNILSGEYPGVVCDEIETAFPGAVCLLLQGFCGDLRPDLSRDGQFYRADYAQMEICGKQLSALFLDALEQPDLPLLPLTTPSYFRQRQISLPLQPVMNNEQLIQFRDEHAPDTIEHEWAVYKLKQTERGISLRAEQTITLTCLHLSPQLKLLTVSAEVVNHYQQLLRAKGQYFLGIGYSNGMAGYLPSARQIAEGGYEPHGSAYYFYLDAPFAPQAEHLFTEALFRLSEEHNHD
ncbi:TPA: hypothetical protein ACWL6U_000329 [Morganella morganii]